MMPRRAAAENTVRALLENQRLQAVYALVRDRQVRAAFASARRSQFSPRVTVTETAKQLKSDLREGLRREYLTMLGYTLAVAVVIVLASFFVYDGVLPWLVTAVGIGDAGNAFLDEAFENGTDLVVFALLAAVPLMNFGRLLFVARIAGKNPARMFTLRSLFRTDGVKLLALIVAVPFLSRQLFESTGVGNVLNTLGPLLSQLPTAWGVDAVVVREYVVVLSVLYLYPAIILVYLSHSKLSRLYPFTQFLSVAKSWSYFLLVLTTVPIAVGATLLVAVADERSSTDVMFVFAFVVLALLTIQYLFTRLGTVVVADERLRETFTREVDREVQSTLSAFS